MRPWLPLLSLIAWLLGVPLCIQAQQVSSVTVTPAVVTGGATSQGTVTLTSAPLSAVTVTLSSSDTTLATVPSKVVVPANNTQATFTVATSPVTTAAVATLSASYGGVTKNAALTLNPGPTLLLSPIADAYVRDGTYADTNFGTNVSLLVKKNAGGTDDLNRCSYLKFDLTGLTSLPLSATLKFYVDAASSPAGTIQTIKCYSVTDTSWTESGITWNNAPGLNRSNTTSTGTLLGTQGVPMEIGTLAFDLTSFVAANRGQIVTLQLLDDLVEQMGAVLKSRDSASVPVRPRLLLTFNSVSTALPAWAEDILPTDAVPATGNGPSSADSVNLETGEEQNQPGPDLIARNPTGPDAAYTRQYRSLSAYQGYSSPGLSPGWTDNYDLSVQGPSQSGAWGPLTLVYPNGATETWTVPTFTGTNPVTLTPPSGAPYTVQGQPSPTAGVWSSLTITFKDLSTWTFTPSSNRYRLTTIGDPLYVPNGSVHALQINRNNTNGSLQSLADAAGNHLLEFGYNQDGTLLSVTDVAAPGADQRQVAYRFASFTGLSMNCLKDVSPTQLPGTLNWTSRWQYNYTPLAGQPLLTNVSVPDPTQAQQLRSNTITYQNGRVASLQDANSNQRVYTYNADQTTKVDVVDHSNGQTIQTWTQRFGASGADTGTTDANSQQNAIVYGDTANPFQATTLTNKNSQPPTNLTYDDNSIVKAGSLTSVQVPANGSTLTTLSTYTYSTIFPLGVLTQIQDGGKTPTKFSYYDGTTPALVNGQQVLQGKGLLATVQTTYKDAAGNILPMQFHQLNELLRIGLLEDDCKVVGVNGARPMGC